MTPNERADAVYEKFKSTTRYGDVMKAFGFDNNTMYTTVQKLLKQGRLRKVGLGKYEIGDGVPVAAPTRQKREKKVEQAAPAPVVIEPVVLPTVLRDDVEKTADDLLGKIGSLKPLLLLHADMFREIEESMLRLLDQIIAIKPRLLTTEQLEEYKELKAIKMRALQIAEQRHYVNGVKHHS